MTTQTELHTAGHWKTGGTHDCHVYGKDYISGQPRFVVRCRAAGNTTAENQANARLIAASPELLELAEAFADAVISGPGRDHLATYWPELAELYEDTRSTLRKVYGEL